MGRRHIHFIRKDKTPNKQVRPIEEFEKEIAAGKYYGTENSKLDHHYYSVSELPEPLREEGKRLYDNPPS